MADDKGRGIYSKYRVERTDGKSTGRCIVLELDDPSAWAALLVWADTVQAEGYAALANDVRTWVDQEKRADCRQSRALN